MGNWKKSAAQFGARLVWKLVAVILQIFKYFVTVGIPFVAFTVIPYVWKKIKPYFEKQKSQYYNNDLVDKVENLADQLAPSPDYIREAKQAAQKIFDRLKSEGSQMGVKIGRTKIAGSIGKNTGISYMKNGIMRNPDLDLVPCINDEQPPFANVHRKLEKILYGLEGVSNINVKTYSIQFQIATPTQGNIKVDLVAAPNFVKNTGQWAGQDIGEVETTLALQNLQGVQIRSIRETQSVDVQENKRISSAFAAKTVADITSRVSDPFVLKEVRLAKFWTASRNVRMRSCMAELIAIWSQRNHRGRGRNGNNRCIVSGFRRFLKAIRNLRNLDIALDDFNNNNSNNGKIWKNYPKPMVRDPGNWWNNLAEGLHPDDINILVRQAIKSLKALEKYKKGVGYKSVENAIDEIFCH